VEQLQQLDVLILVVEVVRELVLLVVDLKQVVQE
tara:strand:+ start:356 stop:457 length:102 start_codon:yes stop_codon:yes gene_type:complete